MKGVRSGRRGGAGAGDVMRSGGVVMACGRIAEVIHLIYEFSTFSNGDRLQSVRQGTRRGGSKEGRSRSSD